MVSRNADMADYWSPRFCTVFGAGDATDKKKTPKNNFYLWLTWKEFCVTCHVKNRFESQTKATDFHGILHFDAITDQTDASPIFFGKFRVVAGIKCWTLNTSKGI